MHQGDPSREHEERLHHPMLQAWTGINRSMFRAPKSIRVAGWGGGGWLRLFRAFSLLYWGG